ncbi:MAG: methionine--tRNA ligase [Armatimonadota bacterium]
MNNKPFYITTPIYYVNDVPHVGNAYTTIVADIIKKYHLLKGNDVYLLTGTDENAPKVAQAAKDNNLEPKVYVDKLAEDFKAVWNSLDINYDDFIRTTEKRHVDVVKAVFKRLLDQGDIYKGNYEGWYCVPCETFYLESELGDDHKCPACNRDLEWVQEENYYFKLSAYSDKLLQYVEQNPDFLQPVFRKNEVVSFIKDGLRDVSITRRNQGWGIPVPDDEDKVIYVWFDALLNYISAIGYLSDDEMFAKYWPADIQLMGKDIFVRFHCTFWPAMLMALDLPMPKVLFGHGFWTINGEKISKSKGNAISPSKLAEDLSNDSGASRAVCLDAVRYFLVREVTFGLDGDFSISSLNNRFNSDLANDLGNLLNRTLSMLGKYFNCVIPHHNEYAEELNITIEQAYKGYVENFDKYDFGKALDSVWQMISSANKYVNDREPWTLAKNNKTEELGGVLYSALLAARAAAVMMRPIMPHASLEIAKQLGIADEFNDIKLDSVLDFNALKSGTKALKPEPIFPRLDTKKKQENPKVEEKELKPESEKKAEDTINYDYFSKLKIRIAEVLEAEKVEGADKLLKLQVSLGDEKRQIVAGIAQHYAPESLIGKKIVMLANLEKAKIRGVESNGMLLAADIGGRPVILQPELPEVPAGSKVK